MYDTLAIFLGIPLLITVPVVKAIFAVRREDAIAAAKQRHPSNFGSAS